MKMRPKIWMIGYFVIVAGMLSIIGGQVVKVDPFFHYHRPNTELYYYPLDNQRNVNDGIVRHFEYDALITGSSMTENFKATEMDAIFGVHSVKVPFSGGSYKEVNDMLARALKCDPDLATVVRSLDMNYFFNTKDVMREDLGEYPTYLYDDNVINDVKYIFNRDIIFNRVYSMLRENDAPGFVPGILAFDEYCYWSFLYPYGTNLASRSAIVSEGPVEPVHITEEEKEIIHDNIEQNVTSLAREYPDVDFYYFFPPYSAAWWEVKVADGTIYKQIEAEECIIEQILQCGNIKLFSFNNRTDITTDINHYRDNDHYGSWINSLMLKWMHDGQYILTEENYKEYLWQELSFYTTYDYSLLYEQADYENDLLAEALLREELTGVEPLGLLPECEPKDAGMEVVVEEIGPYGYLVFESEEDVWADVHIYDENQEEAAVPMVDGYEAYDIQHQYIWDVSRLTGRATIVYNGIYMDAAQAGNASDAFCDITLY
ncbi:MAG: hypothetical protein NC305_05565 [Lachnospiraceae bacterium]|nr:hypothetical protein [Butyrivibrio sp.]MCM1409997.1 hypothetical protein [Lachnospiraceae bacterium]